MSDLLPIGKLEDQHLEFKSAKEIDSIARSKSDLGRSVVAMLNARDGGTIWIGIAERDGIASEIENVLNPTRAREAVINHLISTIEPRLTEGDLHLEVVTAGANTVLRLDVREGRNKPYAFERQRSPYFVRFGPRIRGMTREELREAFAATREPDLAALDAVKNDLRNRRVELGRNPESILWVGLTAVCEKGWHIQFDLGNVKRRRLLADARETGSRQGSVLATDRIEPVLRQGSLSIGHPEWGHITITREGHLEQVLPIHRLWDRRVSNEKASGLIHPIAWIENVDFPLRLMSAILNGSAARVRASKSLLLGPDDLEQIEIAASVAMLNAEGLRMKPHSPGLLAYLAAEEGRLQTTDRHWHTEAVFAATEVAQKPDLCAFQLTKSFYSDFQFEPIDLRGGDGIPREFDRVTGRLVLAQ